MKDIFIDPVFYRYFEQSPLKLVDVGASGGLQGNWGAAGRFLQVIGFEPTETGYAGILDRSNSRVKYLNTALYRQRATIELYCTADPEKSSIYLPNRAFLDHFPYPQRFDIVRKIPLDADTLDSQLQEHGIEDVDFIKLDTQGSELAILQGGDSAVQSAFGLEIEVEFAEVYQGQPLFGDSDNFVRSKGFHLMDFKPYYWKRVQGKTYGYDKGQLVFADVLYLKDMQVFAGNLHELQDAGTRKSKVLRAVSICILYGYFDIALEVFEPNRSLFTADENTAFDGFVKSSIVLSNRLPHFPGRDRLARLFGFLHRALKRRGWAATGSALGNLE